MNKNLKFLQGKEGKELEQIGYNIFIKIGLNCLYDLPQVQLNDIVSGHPQGEHLEFDYIILEKKTCLIGEITARSNPNKISKKYKTFIKQINIIKNIESSLNLWKKLGVKEEEIRNFRDIDKIRGFFITTTHEKSDVNLSSVDDMVVFYKSDFNRIKEYSESIGKWTKNYFLNNFGVEDTTNNALTIYEKDNSLIRSLNKKISKKDIILADLYTFSVSPYEILDIAHVYRRDELPSLQNSTYNYQRPLNHQKLQEIRNNLLSDQDFMFPSNILVILSKECKYTKDGIDNSYLSIPKKYGSLSVIDGQHRLFSYANEKVQKTMTNHCQIMVTAVDFQTKEQSLISQLSAKVFIEINVNQTKVEISHIDKIAYELGSDDPKVIATKIIVSLNNRQDFSNFFDVKSDKINKGMVDAVTIIDVIKKITNLNKVNTLEKATRGKQKCKKDGFEKIFEATITDLSNRDVLVKQSTKVFEQYFNRILSVFKYDDPRSKHEIKTSFFLSKFWGGWVNLLIVFLEEDLDWNCITNELKKIKDNVIKLRQMQNYDQPLFNPNEREIPDSSHSPTKVCKFLKENREKPTSIQDI